MKVVGKVVQINCDLFFADVGERIIPAKIRKKINFHSDDVFVGDNVEIELSNDASTIEKVLPRRNRLLRPSVANVDNAAILISESPPPDLMLVDKVIINCFNENIVPLVAVSKADVIDGSFVDRMITNFSQVCHVEVISSVSGEGLIRLSELLKGKTTCLVGQSAVGKSSLINALNPGFGLDVGRVSLRSGRGTHTTRKSHILRLDENTYIIDSSGFSLFDVNFISSADLRLYYPEFGAYLNKCRFDACTHNEEPGCVIKKAASTGEISNERYLRYIELLRQIQIQEKKRYL